MFNKIALGLEYREELIELTKAGEIGFLSESSIKGLYGWAYEIREFGSIKVFASVDDIGENLVDWLNESIDSSTSTDLHELDWSFFDNIDNGCCINTIESVEKSAGYATKLIDKLKEEYISILIVPHEEVIDFWAKQGFKKVSDVFWVWEE